MKEALKKAKRARDMTGGQIQVLEDALVKASSMLTKQGKQKRLGQQQELTSLAKRLKDVCAKQHLGLPALKELLVEVTKANKAAKDHVKELVQLVHKAPSKAASRAASSRAASSKTKK